MTNEEKEKVMIKAGYVNPVDYCYLIPRKIYDYSNLTTNIAECYDGQFVAVEGIFTKLRCETAYTGRKIVKAQLVSRQHDKDVTFYINYFGQRQMFDILSPLLEKECVVAGTLKRLNGNYLINAPILFSQKSRMTKSYSTVYRKFKGTSDEFLRKRIKENLSATELVETIPDDIREKLNIIGRKESIMNFHFPKSKEDIMKSIKRNLVEDMLYLACKLNIENDTECDSEYIVTGKEEYAHIIKDSLPYILTKEQLKVINSIIINMKNGKKTSSLVQGDVGCGKTITAFMLMLMFAYHGWQSVIMTPTQVLARQHYLELKEYADKLNIEVVLLSGTNTAKQEKTALEKIESGKAKLIVGTHKLISDKVTYNNVGLVVIDEEQRFGVEARQILQDKAGKTAHFISFSATPIPRTFAQTLYSNMDMYEIKQLPSNRKPVVTKIVHDSDSVMQAVKSEIQRGGQCYIVCPLIDTEDETNTKKTVKEVAEYYKKQLGTEVGVVTGELDNKSTAKTLDSFNNGQIKILVATTVIEVGVNNPNANTIIIEDANMFGLSQLHQLRGRVGRGSTQGYCYLSVNEDADVRRLNILESTNDGFVIAEEDFKQRGAGNIIGTEQSGNNHYLDVAMQYPNMYSQISSIADEMTKNKSALVLIEEMEKRTLKSCIDYKKIKYFKS